MVPPENPLVEISYSLTFVRLGLSRHATQGLGEEGWVC